jgi:hypothetical protein
MRKLFVLLAAFLAFRGGRGAIKSGRGELPPGVEGNKGIGLKGLGLGSLLAFWMAPRWLRPIMLAKAMRREPR